MEKSAEAFRTISEVADELGVPKHVLRFWEGKFGQIKPMKRGGGRRYYRPEDVELLRGIRKLLHDEGLTIKGVQKVIRQSGIEYVKQFWRQDAGLPATGKGAVVASPVKASGKGPRGGKPKAGAAPVAAAAAPSKGLATTRVLLLQKVLRELEACRDLLEARV